MGVLYVVSFCLDRQKLRTPRGRWLRIAYWYAKRSNVTVLLRHIVGLIPRNVELNFFISERLNYTYSTVLISCSLISTEPNISCVKHSVKTPTHFRLTKAYRYQNTDFIPLFPFLCLLRYFQRLLLDALPLTPVIRLPFYAIEDTKRGVLQPWVQIRLPE